MKKLLLLFVFCLICSVMFAQKVKKERFKGDDIYYNSGKETKKEFVSGETDQTKWIIESLDKYRKESSLGTQIEILGFAAAAVSLGYSNKPDDQKVILIASGVTVLVGYLISANAVRHLSKKRLTLSGNGLSLRF